jgi:hypothetical protein
VFPLVQERARVLRTKLEQRGARFVVGFFDESVQYTRWGLISRDAHRHDLLSLAEAVLKDVTLGVIIKPKYAWNNPRQLYPNEPSLRAALETGRYLIMEKGEHRSAHFPAETALASDICVGHLYATSASLEATLAGVRALLIRRYADRTLLDPLLSGLDVVYPSIEAVLEAITHLRDRRAGTAALGDWSSVLAKIDPHRDGKASQRLRALLEGWATCTEEQHVHGPVGRPSARTAAL